jgi:hypothetical protein
MPNPTRLSTLSCILAGILILYSASLCAVSLHILYTAIHEGSPLNFAAIVVETLTLLFLPLLIAGLWKPRLISILLFAAAAAILSLTLTTPHAAPSTTAGMIGASLLFLGVPMLAAAIFFHLIAGNNPTKHRTQTEN